LDGGLDIVLLAYQVCDVRNVDTHALEDCKTEKKPSWQENKKRTSHEPVFWSL